MDSKEDKWLGIEDFLGSWQAEETANDDFMAAAGVPWLLRKMAKRATPPIHHITREEGMDAIRIRVEGVSGNDTLYPADQESVTYVVERTGAKYEDTTYMDSKGRLYSQKVRESDSFTVEATREICDGGDAHVMLLVGTKTDGTQVKQEIIFRRVSSAESKNTAEAKSSYDDDYKNANCESPQAESKSGDGESKASFK
uniref:Uncharacterized protein n=1 Tax=Pinguiococcus pyrenoidosus TaxID=172671 RepID=A0A7R9YF10_9STRA|mmetsp:Transcript_8257/g.31050  ORF Transcript_8257/g.31050 Transcript_8257/m.31050 type:complete len:198 (+) Transcript_8257:245-838(+)